MTAVAHVGVTVTDLDRAVRWYGDVLGLEPIGAVVEVRAGDGHGGAVAADVFGPGFDRFRQAHLAGANGVALELFGDLPRLLRRRRRGGGGRAGRPAHLARLEAVPGRALSHLLLRGPLRQPDRAVLAQPRTDVGKSVIVVGLGRIGRLHAANLASRMRLAGVVDAVESVARAVGDRHGVPWSTSLDDLLPHTRGVVIAAPTNLHAELVSRAAKHHPHQAKDQKRAHQVGDDQQARAVGAGQRAHHDTLSPRRVPDWIHLAGRGPG